MEGKILLEQIKKYNETYNKDKTNKIIENQITNNGLEKACINRDIIIENQPVFNIELPESKRYDQKNNHRCWIYGGLNLIKHNMAKNLNVDVMNFELSNNYIAFFDKLEKSNNTYENIINSKNIDFDYIHKERMTAFCVPEGGYFQWFVAIINKYGIVPYSYNPDVVESTNYEKLEYLYTEKVKKDILELIELKKQEKDLENLREIKDRLLQENYILLCKVLGQPVSEFDYEYKDRNGKYIKYERLTPIEFKDKFLSLNLNDFITIGNLPMYNKEYYKVYKKKYLGNVYQSSDVTYLNLPIEDLKELTIKQLKDNIPVYMGGHFRKFRDTKTGILDTRLYNYKETLNINRLTKEEALNLHDISMHHIMTFTGVNLIDDKPQRWKVEDSGGDKEKANGYYIMNDNFFNEFVLSIVVDKKYLSKEQLELLKQEPIEFEIGEPF